jgi:hypothetical protein
MPVWKKSDRRSIRRLLGLALVLPLWLAGCGGGGDSPEAMLRQSIDALQHAAEERSLSGFMAHISENYMDEGGRTRKDVRALAQLQFIRNPNIHTFKVVHDPTLTDDRNARVTVLAALAGRPIDGASALTGLRAELMRFDLDFVLEDSWRITSARWSRAQPVDFLGQ